MALKSLLLASCCALLGSGCATILKGSRNELVLHSAPDDLRAFEGRSEVPLTKIGSAADGTVKFTGGVHHNTAEIMLQTQDVRYGVPLNSSVGVGWVVADFLLTGLLGVLIDAGTGKWKSPDDVNVKAAIAQSVAQGRTFPAGDPNTSLRAAPAAASVAARQPAEDGGRIAAVAPAPDAIRVDRSGGPPPAPAGAAVVTRGKLAVLDFKSYAADFKPEDVRYFTDLIRGATLRVSPALEVMTRENLLVLLQATGRELSKCEGECEVDTGRRIGADAVISGEVLKVGSRYKMSLKLHDTHAGRLLSTSIASGKTIDELDESAQKAAEELLRPKR